MIASGGRQLLAAVNPAAAAAGLAPGMALPDALSFLPGLATRPAAPAEDAASLHRLAEWCSRYSPWTAPDGTDGVRIEITGSAHLWGGEAALAADLARRLGRQCLACRVAVAGTLGAAWALARCAAGENKPVLVAPDDMPAALAPLPVAALRLDPATVAGLQRVGIRHIGELAAMPRDALARRFGEGVARRLDQAFDRLPEPLSPLGAAPVRRVRLSFAEPIADPADFVRAIERLTETLVPWLAREGTGARRLDLAFHRIDGRVERIRLGTARPSRDPHHLAGLLTARLDTVDPGLGVEDMILAAPAVETLPAEQAPLPASSSSSASGGRGRKNDGTQAADIAGLAPLLDRLGARLGLAAIGRLEARASHIPERASANVPIGQGASPPHPPRGGTTGPLSLLPEGRRERGGTTATPSPPLGTEGKWQGIAPHRPPRPVRLFRPPEPIEASWLVPDDPPFQFGWRRRRHRVRRADGPERIAAEWWRPEGHPTCRPDDGPPGYAAGAIRDYYRIEDAEGRRFWLFRAGLAGGGAPPRWFVHGVFA